MSKFKEDLKNVTNTTCAKNDHIIHRTRIQIRIIYCVHIMITAKYLDINMSVYQRGNLINNIEREDINIRRWRVQNVKQQIRFADCKDTFHQDINTNIMISEYQYIRISIYQNINITAKSSLIRISGYQYLASPLSLFHSLYDRAVFIKSDDTNQQSIRLFVFQIIMNRK